MDEFLFDLADARIRITDSTGQVLADDLDPANYHEFLGESVEPDSYLKSPYYLPMGYPDGIYRVGQFYRSNICSHT
jgi:NAD-reducing hydrogenase large subunit